MSALYRKYRPQVFGDVVGQDHVVKTLEQAIALDRVAHAYLFSGPRGVGKTTVARILAKAVNCLDSKKKPCGKCRNCQDIAQAKFIDLIEIDAASNRGIDEIRDLRDKIRFSPSVGRKKVYIIDEVHMLTREAFNALLKTLEEPPAHSIFIFATTEAHKLPETVISRCQRFDFFLGADELISGNISKIAQKEKLNLSDDVLKLITRSSGGSYRDALSSLDQLSSHLVKGELSSHDALKVLNLTNLDNVITFVDFLKDSDLMGAMKHLDDLSSKGIDFEQYLNQLIVFVRGEMIGNLQENQPVVWQKETLGRLIEAASLSKNSPIDSLPLELFAVDICNPAVSRQPSAAREIPKPNTVDNPLKAESAQKVVPKKSVVIQSIDTEKKIAVIEAVNSVNKPLGALIGLADWQCSQRKIIMIVEYPLHKDKIMARGNRALLESEIEKVTGSSIPIECEVQKKKISEDLNKEIDEVFG